MFISGDTKKNRGNTIEEECGECPKWDVILYVKIWLGRSRKDIMNVIVAHMVIINDWIR